MDRLEMSQRFDVLYNNISSNKAPGLNEYEKSIFLTKGQDELVKNYFSPENNPHQKGYDDNAKRQTDFSMLMKTWSKRPILTDVSTDTFVDPRSFQVSMPADMMFTINESVVFKDDTESKILAIRQVIPLSYQEYTMLMSKPFKEPLKYQAWRLITSTESPVSAAHAELILTSADIADYTKEVGGYPYYIIRYVKRPNPIILVDLKDAFGEELKIQGENEAKDCELNPSIHEEIVQRAVELAKAAWQGDLNAAIQTGQRSE